MGDFESALAEGVRMAFAGQPELVKGFVGAKRRLKMYQVPVKMAEEVNKNFRPTHPLVRLFWDRPTDLWRSTVLAYSPRWHLNNMLGGIILGTTGGVPARRLFKPLTKAEKASLPTELQAQSQIFVESFKPHLGAAADTSTGKIFQAIANSKPMKWGTKPLARTRDISYALNQRVDTHFRNRVYLEFAKKEARTQLARETGQSIIRSRDILNRVKDLGEDVASRRALMKEMNNVYFNFNNMTHFERTYIRRLVPFWSWYREIHRVAANLPFRAPGKVQALRVLGDMGKQADDAEVRKHLGIAKKWLPEYLQDQIFVGLDNDDRIVFYSPRGGNVFYGVGKWPIDSTVLHPTIRMAINEISGGNTFGRWGSFAPFRYKEAGERLALDERTGKLERKKPMRAMGLKAARTTPIVSLMEDLVQYGTEGVVSRRFEDVTPLSNIPAALTGGVVEPTAIYDREKEPKRERTLAEVGRSFAGIGTGRYKLEELIEQEVKGSKRDVEVIFSNLFNSNPEFRKLFLEVVGEMAGTPEKALETIQGRER